MEYTSLQSDWHTFKKLKLKLKTTNTVVHVGKGDLRSFIVDGSTDCFNLFGKQCSIISNNVFQNNMT